MQLPERSEGGADDFLAERSAVPSVEWWDVSVHSVGSQRAMNSMGQALASVLLCEMLCQANAVPSHCGSKLAAASQGPQCLRFRS